MNTKPTDNTKIQVKTKNSSRKRAALKKLWQISLRLLSSAIIIGSAASTAGAVNATDAAKSVVGAEGGKEAMNQALKLARGKPALSLATAIVCLACIPVAGAAASPGMCIACGLLIAKTIG